MKGQRTHYLARSRNGKWEGYEDVGDYARQNADLCQVWVIICFQQDRRMGIA